LFSIPNLIISPNNWPSDNSKPRSSRLHPQPGDLSQFLANQSARYLDANAHGMYTNPILTAALYEGKGGTILFDNHIDPSDLETSMKAIVMVEPPGALRSYVVYANESKNPKEDNYLRQLRFVSFFAMEHLFRAISHEQAEKLPLQPWLLTEAVRDFVQSERQFWGTGFGAPKLERLFGGNANSAREELSFGLQVENVYHGVFRLWSRAWLVTK